MNERIGRLLAVGNVAEMFEWGARAVKLTNPPPPSRQLSAKRQFTRPPKQWDFQCPRFGAGKGLEVDGGALTG